MSTNLQALRIAKGVSVTDLAQQASVTVSYISKVEKGVFPLTSALIRKLCPLLGCDEADFQNNADAPMYSFGGRDVTFKGNLLLSIHKWYPYIEGFSERFVKDILEKHPPSSLVYDPFNGSGTTMLTAAYSGYRCIAAEINPFMQFVAYVKVNTVKAIIADKDKLARLTEAKARFATFSDSNYGKVPISEHINDCFIHDGFFAPMALEKIAFIKSIIATVKDADIQDTLKLCLASILVEVSTMIRAADLRKRTPSEIHFCEEKVISLFNEKLASIVHDIGTLESVMIADARIISNNAKALAPEWEDTVDVIITSPPYINGTNYFRNTKIELWILDFISKPDDLRKYRSKAITAGINNVSKDIDTPLSFPFVEKYAKLVSAIAPDKRIPTMIRAYFSDMSVVFSNFSSMLKPGGKLYFDIGDSEYYGVHIPVDEIIERIASDRGFLLRQSLVTRNRKSKRGTTLKQKLLVFEKSAVNPIVAAICAFGDEFPYKSGEYAKRNWGSNMHSLCSYQGKLKPAIAYHLIQRFTRQGDTVLDPFCGIGTIPLEACLNGRIGIGIDINDIGYANTLAKVSKLDAHKVEMEIQKLDTFMQGYTPSNNELLQADCKLPISNGAISEYYHFDTLKEIIAARRYFQTISKENAEQQFLFACMLHILHGNRPYALSKRSNNQTPLKPRADDEAIYKNVIEKVREKAERMYKCLQYTDMFRTGGAYCTSVFSNPIQSDAIDAIITSPPFASSTRFYSSNWLRLWFCGWESSDFFVQKERFIDYQQERDFDCVYKDVLNCFWRVLKPTGLVVMHLGKTEKIDMLRRISALVNQDERFEHLGAVEESVTECNKHGLRDQGATTDHQFLFFRKR